MAKSMNFYLEGDAPRRGLVVRDRRTGCTIAEEEGKDRSDPDEFKSSRSRKWREKSAYTK